MTVEITGSRQLFYSDTTPDIQDFTGFTPAAGDIFYNCSSTGGRGDAIFFYDGSSWNSIA